MTGSPHAILERFLIPPSADLADGHSPFFASNCNRTAFRASQPNAPQFAAHLLMASWRSERH
jgi:hypothetical protein